MIKHGKKMRLLSIVMILMFAMTAMMTGCTSGGKNTADNTNINTASNNADNTTENTTGNTAGNTTGNSTSVTSDLKDITVLLDWVPNTNHTGLYVSLDKGYYAEEGLEVKIIQPAEGGSADLIAANQGQFGISYQEQVTYARTAESPLPVKAIAAIIQHNTSGFASPADRNIKTPEDFEGKKYGGWGSPMEEAMLRGIMQKAGADYSRLQSINIGAADFFTSVRKDVDFTWIYYGWDGIAAQLKSFPINFIKLQDVDPKLDFYTPVIIANEDLLKSDPEMVRKFLRATSKGYEFAVSNPEEAASSLLKYAGEIDKELAVESQKYLAGEYLRGTERWGDMKLEMWKNYSGWMYENGLITKELDAEQAFTNEFLP